MKRVRDRIRTWLRGDESAARTDKSSQIEKTAHAGHDVAEGSNDTEAGQTGTVGTVDQSNKTAEVPAEPEHPRAGVAGGQKKGAHLDDRLVDVFCATFGEKYREVVDAQTDMDDIPDWDSENFLNLVFALEDEYSVTFTDSEAAQMFQLGHIQRVVNHATQSLPHDDVAHAICQIYRLQRAPAEQFKIVVLSGSSTREGFLQPDEALQRLKEESGAADVGWYNVSVSGLVVAETVQLLELIDNLENAVILVGYSAIILGGCGRAEFERAASHERFPFNTPLSDQILAEHGYAVASETQRPRITIETWVRRYLGDRSLEDLHYTPYLYPTLAPWPPERYFDEDAILRFYNGAPKNYAESIKVNEKLLDGIAQRLTDQPWGLIELTLHSNVRQLLERLGGIETAADATLKNVLAAYQPGYADLPVRAEIQDKNFRDPAHIFEKRWRYTTEAIRFALQLRRGEREQDQRKPVND